MSFLLLSYFSFLCYHLDGKTDLLRWEEFREACAGIIRHFEPTFLQSHAIAGSQKPSKDMAGADFAFTVATGRMWQDNQPVFGFRWYIPGVHSNIYCQIPWAFRRFPSGRAFREKRDLDATSVYGLRFTHWYMLKRSKEEKIERYWKIQRYPPMIPWLLEICVVMRGTNSCGTLRREAFEPSSRAQVVAAWVLDWLVQTAFLGSCSWQVPYWETQSQGDMAMTSETSE